MPRPRATMEESTGGTPTTPIAAGNEFTSDDGSRRSRDDDGCVDLEDSDDDWDPAATAVAGGASTPDAVLDHDMEENATVVGDKLARRRRPRGGGKHNQRHTRCPQNRHFFFEQTFSYILKRSAQKREASKPPVPALISTIAFLSSSSSLGRNKIFSLFS